MDPSPNPPSVAMVVLNSISHDARVLKEAHALAEHGWNVSIVGIQDGNCAEPETDYPLGVTAYRVGGDLFEDVNIPAALAREIGIRLIAATLIGAVVLAFLALFFFVPDIVGRVIALDMVTLRVLSVVAGVVALALLVRWVLRLRLGQRMSEEATGVKVSLLRRRRHGHLRALIAQRVVQLAPDVLHCHDVTGLRIGKVCLEHGYTGKLVFDSHELYEDLPYASAWHRFRTRQIQDEMAPRLSGFVTINDSIAAVLKRRHPLLPEPVIVKNAVRLPARPVADDGRLHHAAGLEEGTKILLYQGGFAPNRGLTPLVRSAAMLPEGWAIVMMGWGREEKNLRKDAAAVDPEGLRVRFVPRVPQHELVHWTAGATVGIIPYARHGLNHWFCTPNKLWEYPAAGVPILASPFPELRKVVQGHDVGILLSDPIKPESIAWSLRELTDERLAQLRENCRTFIELDNWSLYESRLRALYDRVLANGHR